MKAIVSEVYGPPELMKQVDIEIPKPGKDEILVKIMETTVNRTDCAILRAKPFIMRFMTGMFKPKKTIIGTEFSGIVEAVGQNVSNFKIGDKIYGFNDNILSTYAEYTVINTDQPILKMPDHFSFPEAAAATEGAHYAYNIVNKVDVKKGDKIVVIGATGGIGSALVQILAALDVEILGVCEEKSFELVKSLGAKEVLDYKKEDFANLGIQYDYIFDSVGKRSFGECKPALTKKGVYISSELGAYSQNIFYSMFTPMFGGKKVVFPFPKSIKDSMTYIRGLIDSNKFKPVIDREYSLEEIPKAFEYVEKGQKIGNVVIRVGS